MKSSAPQTTMSISLAPIMVERPPEGAETLAQVYTRAVAQGETSTKGAFGKRLAVLVEMGDSGIVCKKFRVGGRGLNHYWQEKVK